MPDPASSSNSKVNVLLVGGGGREHAIAVKLAASPRLGEFWTTHPDNPGLASLCKAVDVPVSIREIYRLQQFIEKKKIGLVVIGPEDPLAEGYTDKLRTPTTLVFGPTAQAAQLEADKSWAKQLMRAASIPTADAQSFTSIHAARALIEARVRDTELLESLLGPAKDFAGNDERRTFILKCISEVVTRVPSNGDSTVTQRMRARAVLSAVFAIGESFRDPADRARFVDALRTTDPVVKQACDTQLEDLPVIKASGLAKGKGVILPKTYGEAVEALHRIMVEKEFGDAGLKVVIEERLEGKEVSVLAIVDGHNILVLPPCQDHKRLGDNDTGPNTGGMGAFCPTSLIDSEMMERVEREILVPTLDALRREDIDFKGVLYAGLMLTHAGPKVLEFNTRFGDPECQPLMARLKSDLLEMILATCEGRLDTVDVEWEEGAACCVVLASAGYPDKPKVGIPIQGIDQADSLPGVRVYHGSTRRGPDGQVLTAGGRVLGVTGIGKNLKEARDRAYAGCEFISFAGKTFRTDIASS